MGKLVNLEELKILLQAYTQSGNLNFLIGSGASLPAIPLAGNIESEIDEFLNNGDEQSADLKAAEFIDGIETKHRYLVNLNERDDTVESTLQNYIAFINAVDDLLFERKTQLIPRQANLFTTNYDLFIEYAASKIPSLLLNDGFDRQSAIDDKFTYSPEIFHDRTYRSGTVFSLQSEVPTLNLFKLHGSLNWAYRDTSIVMSSSTKPPLTDQQKNDPELIKGYLDQYVTIMPNSRKFSKTFIDRYYYDLLRQFANAIEKENSVIISFAFSFADDHIADLVKRGLRNPTSQLIIASYSTQERDTMEAKFSSHKNVLILSPEDDSVFEFGDFNKLISSIVSVEQ